MTLPVLDLKTIRAAATRDLVFAAVRDGLVAHAEGRTQVLPPVHLAFADADGDCHVKVGHLAGSPPFTVKISTGFYRNPRIGLPTNNGTMVVLDAATGAPLAVLADDGWLTAWRTAAAGALITNALTPAEVDEVGVLGTGLQARLQTEWLHALRPLTRVNIWGRRPDAARQLCADLQNIGIDARSLGLDEAAGAPCVITATTATAPLAPATAFDTAQHITAVGADMPGKNELPPELFSRATLIATHDHAQCLDHGDFGSAVRAGHATADSDVAIGALLGGGAVVRSGLSIADLTGIGALDAALASAVVNRLGIGRTTPVPDAIHVQAADQRLRMPAQVGRSSENLENTLRYRIIDAFTDQPFAGNPAAVFLLDTDEWPDAGWMQQVALEMGASETAFAHPLPHGADADWSLRWFTPAVEDVLCGHATLATAHALHADHGRAGAIRFRTRSGVLVARTSDNGTVTLEFPRAVVSEMPVPEGLGDALGVVPAATYDTGALGDILAVFPAEEIVRALTPNFAALTEIQLRTPRPDRGVIATAPAARSECGYHFVSRFFTPAAGIPEDPVTGSAHTALAPYWSSRLGSAALTGLQASRRGGMIQTSVAGDVVHLTGTAVTVAEGRLLNHAHPSSEYP